MVNQYKKTRGFLLQISMIGLLITPNLTLAHGEDKPGPNGGHIRMPGPFHTEVIVKNKLIKVYLLDIAFKNPTIADSEVKASIQDGTKTTALKCSTKTDHYECESPIFLQSGTLIVQATRNKVRGNEAKYPLPLH